MKKASSRSRRPSQRAPRSPAAKRRPGRSSSSSPRGADATVGKRIEAELAALRAEWARASAAMKDAIQKIERLTAAVADLQDEVADLHASLGEGEVDYGTAEEGNHEVGEGHA